MIELATGRARAGPFGTIENQPLTARQYCEWRNAQRLHDLVRKSTPEALHKAHHEFLRAQRQLVEQEKMASLGRLVAGVAHELNNPISFVYGNIHTRLVVSAVRKGNEILVRISDNGPGVDKDHISHIFEPFFTTKRVGEGTGLGLWISYGIVREHGGELVAANEPEGGATFSFALPAASAGPSD